QTPARSEGTLRVFPVRLVVEVRAQQEVGPRDTEKGGDHSSLKYGYSTLAHEDVRGKPHSRGIQDRSQEFLDRYKEPLGREVDGNGEDEEQSGLENRRPDLQRQKNVGRHRHRGDPNQNCEMALIKTVAMC